MTLWRRPASRPWPRWPPAPSPSTTYDPSGSSVLRTQAALQVQARQQPEEKPPFVADRAGRGSRLGPRLRATPRARPGRHLPRLRGSSVLASRSRVCSSCSATWRPTKRASGGSTSCGPTTKPASGPWSRNWSASSPTAGPPTRACTSTTTTTPSDRRSSRWPPSTPWPRPALAELVDAGVFVDLLVVARNAVQVGTEGYGLKHLERLTDYERSHEIDKGAGAVVAFDALHGRRRPGPSRRHRRLQRRRRPGHPRTARLAGRPAAGRPRLADHRGRPRGEPADIDVLLEKLSAFEDGSEQRLLADLLGYWIREWRAFIAPIIGKLVEQPPDRAPRRPERPRRPRPARRDSSPDGDGSSSQVARAAVDVSGPAAGSRLRGRPGEGRHLRDLRGAPRLRERRRDRRRRGDDRHRVGRELPGARRHPGSRGGQQLGATETEAGRHRSAGQPGARSGDSRRAEPGDDGPPPRRPAGLLRWWGTAGRPVRRRRGHARPMGDPARPQRSRGPGATGDGQDLPRCPHGQGVGRTRASGSASWR